MLLARSRGPVNNTRLEPWQVDFACFVDSLREPNIGPKDGSYFIRGGKFNGSTARADEHLLAADLVVLDGDKRIIPESSEVVSGAPDPLLVHGVLVGADIAHVIYTSHSNKRDRPRYRVCVPVGLANPQELAACVDWLLDLLHQNGVWLAPGHENYGWARAWYEPRVPDAEHVKVFRFYQHDGGQPFPKPEVLAWWAERQPLGDEPEVEGKSTPPDPNSPIGQFIASHGADWMLHTLQDAGYQLRYTRRRSDNVEYRLLAPASTTGTPGVGLFLGRNGKWLVYSHHGDHDPLAERGPNGRVLAHDAFDLFVRFEHAGDRDAALAALGARQASEPGADEPLDIFAPQLAPSLDLGLLPPVLADYCGSHAEALGVDAGALLLPTLVGLAGVAGLNLSISLRRNAYWVERPILWGLGCGGPGTGKGPAMRAALQPFNAIAEKVVQDSARAARQWEKEVKREGKYAGDRPAWSQLKVDDITIEAVAELAAQNPCGLYGAYEGLTEWLGRMDAYGGSSGKDRPFWLKAYDGQSATVNRRHAAPLVVETLGVSLYGGIQPARVKELVGKSGGSGDGLTQRFLPVMLGPQGESRDVLVAGTEEIARVAAYLRSFTSVTEFPLDDEAYGIFEETRRLFLELCQTYPGAAGFEGHLAKCPGITGRLALVLHAVACADARRIAGVVSGAVMQTAAGLIRRYFLPHAKAFYEGDMARGEQAPRGLAQKVAEWLLSSGRTEPVSARDLMRHVAAFRDASQQLREAAIAELEQAAWLFEIVLEPRPGRGRPPGAKFNINERIHTVFGEQAARCRAQRERWAAAWNGR